MKSGILAVHKPEGISSARVVSRVKKALGAKKVGHTGTLDPFATGLLLCAVNQGTRISRFFLGGHKRYLAQVCLGIETDTYDLTGQTVFAADQKMMAALNPVDVIAAVNSFIGVQDQVAPAFSALKHEGVPLYKLARQGKKIQKPPRRIEIFEIEVLRLDLPYVDIEVFCSTGTYIRSLAFDIGRRLGCGAHLSKLSRTQSSAFSLAQATDLAVLEKLSRTEAQQKIVSLADCLAFMPGIVVSPGVARKIGYGQKLLHEEMGPFPEEPVPFIRLMDQAQTLLAIVQFDKTRCEYNYYCVFSS